MKTIKLGKPYDESYPMPPEAPKKEDSRMSYPGACFYDLPESKDWPDSGYMTVKYQLTRRSEDLKNDKNSVDVDLLEIVEVEPLHEDDPEYNEDTDSFDKTAKEVIDSAKHKEHD